MASGCPLVVRFGYRMMDLGSAGKLLSEESMVSRDRTTMTSTRRVGPTSMAVLRSFGRFEAAVAADAYRLKTMHFGEPRVALLSAAPKRFEDSLKAIWRPAKAEPEATASKGMSSQRSRKMIQRL